jgi:hypothetical protein
VMEHTGKQWPAMTTFKYNSYNSAPRLGGVGCFAPPGIHWNMLGNRVGGSQAAGSVCHRDRRVDDESLPTAFPCAASVHRSRGRHAGGGAGREDELRIGCTRIRSRSDRCMLFIRRRPLPAGRKERQ